jgi:hypothetical protein
LDLLAMASLLAALMRGNHAAAINLARASVARIKLMAWKPGGTTLSGHAGMIKALESP